MHNDIEQKSTNKELESTRCSWCGFSDQEEKIYSSPGDDMENPTAYHRDCFEALKIFMFYAFQNPEDSVESLIKKANRTVGLKRGLRKRLKK
jgi:hypothetical protein